jgi:hypothetical protein
VASANAVLRIIAAASTIVLVVNIAFSFLMPVIRHQVRGSSKAGRSSHRSLSSSIIPSCVVESQLGNQRVVKYLGLTKKRFVIGRNDQEVAAEE